MSARHAYGQFCPVALAAEIVAERWTPLVVRELLSGSRRFGDIQRGVPRMSPTMLARRLHQLERAEIVRRRSADGRVEYVLTPAGQSLDRIIMSLAVWGYRFARKPIAPREVDPGLLMWEIRRWMDLRALPPGRSVILFKFPTASTRLKWWWLVATHREVDLCVQPPGHDPDLTVETDLATLARLWRGDLGVDAAISAGRIRLEGSPALRRAFPRWIGMSALVRPRRPRSGPVPPR